MNVYLWSTELNDALKQSTELGGIYLGSNEVWSPTITEEFTLTNTSQSFYKSWYKPQSIVYECDYYNPSSWWTGCTLKIWDWTNNIWWYIWGWSNIWSYPNSDGKIEKNTTKVYDSTHKYISKWTTVHLKVTFNREWISIKVWNNAEEIYLYSSWSWWPTALSIIDSVTLQTVYWASSWASLSNGVATVTYKPV